jgi:hypothetical protein
LHSAFHEVGIELGFSGETACNTNRLSREIKTSNNRAAPDQRQCARPDVALKVQNLLARDVSQICAFDGAQSVLTRSHAIESVETRRIPRMDPCPLIPVSAIDFDRVDHDDFSICSANHRYNIHLMKRNSSALNLAYPARHG